MDARILIETLQSRGLSISLARDKVRVEALQEPDEDTKVLLRELKDHREEIKALLSQSAPPCWNCSAITTKTKDIYGEAVWVCWACAKTA